MVTPVGHLGIALLVATPAWLRWNGGAAIGVTALVLLAAVLPDLDVVIRELTHHGLTHTVPFVTVVALTGGLVAPVGRRLGPADSGDDVDGHIVFVVATAALFAGGLSHLLADAISITSEGPALHPLAPLTDWSVSLDLVHYADPVANFGALAVGLCAQVLLAYLDVADRSQSPSAEG